MNVLRLFVKCKKYNVSKRFYNIALGDVQKLNGETWDIIISGGGMVGCSLACTLGTSEILEKKKVLLLETSRKSRFDIDPNNYSNRVSALNNSTKHLFEKLNAWSVISDLRFQKVRKLQVWESKSDARVTFEQDRMSDDIAYIVENDVILSALNEKIDRLGDRVDIIRGAKAIDYNLPSSKFDQSELVTVHLENDIQLKTKLLIGADGINSLVRKKMQVKYMSWDYQQKGIVATLMLSEPTENVVAWQRFLPSGPIALLPLTSEMCSLVWTVSVPMSEKLLAMSDENFVDELNSALWDESHKDSITESALSGLKDVLSSVSSGSGNVRQLPPSILSVVPKSRAAFPLGLGHAVEYVAPRVALIGDSAHRVHPLAGQGVNLGFGDVQCLVACLEKAVFGGNDIGCMHYLLEYEVQRQRHVLPTMFAIDALNRLYKTEFIPVVLLRSLGVTVLDMLKPIKDRMIRHAST